MSAAANPLATALAACALALLCSLLTGCAGLRLVAGPPRPRRRATACCECAAWACALGAAYGLLAHLLGALTTT